MNANQWKHSLLLLLTASIWGFAFVAQSVATKYIDTFTFNGIRFMMGSIVLLPYLIIMDNKKKQHLVTKDSGDLIQEKDKGNQTSTALLIKAGVVCGLILCTASALQQIGVKYTPVGKAGFITAIYILLVPILGIFAHKIPEKKIMFCVFIALIGLYLLCVKSGNFSIHRSDWILIASSFVFSLHILAIDYFVEKVDGVKLACLQFFISGIVSLFMMVCFENPNLQHILMAWKPLLYAGVFSCGIAYTLQVVGQKGLNPTIASLIMSLESVIAVLAGWLILGQNLSKREYIGCILVFIAIMIAQLPDFKNNKETEKINGRDSKAEF